MKHKNKLDPRYMGPFRIIERIGAVAYRLALPSELDKIHDVFLVSQLRKYMSDSSHMIIYHPLQIQEDLTYQEKQVQILNEKIKQLRKKNIPLVKLLCRCNKWRKRLGSRKKKALFVSSFILRYVLVLRTKLFEGVRTVTLIKKEKRKKNY